MQACGNRAFDVVRRLTCLTSQSSLAPMTSKQSTWQLHEAKARFSELFRRVRAEGPQRVVKQHGEAVVIVSAEEFDRVSVRRRQPASLVEFFRSAPRGGRPLDLTRKRDTTRTIKWQRACPASCSTRTSCPSS